MSSITPLSISPSIAYAKLLADISGQGDDDSHAHGARGPAPTGGPAPTATSGGARTVGGTGGTEPTQNATQLDIVAAFSKISDRATAYLQDLKKCLEDMNKKIEDLNRKMSEASKNAADLADKKGGKRGGSTDDIDKLARDNQTLVVEHGDTKIEIKLSLNSPGDKGKDGGFTKDQWSSVSQQIQTDVSSIQTQVKTVSADMQISVQNWQTFSNQLLKGLEEMASGLGRIASME
jgi:chaperonin cofactor prefoldin